MKRNVSKSNGYARLLDAWDPPESSGAPIGCVATTFTFSSAFFEEECLGRFIQMESDPVEDGPLYLIEREEKLAALSYAGVLVDQRHCRGVRSLRWDLLSARLPKGILHAKVSLLFWSNHIRLIVGSANLTDQGYRQNQEIFGCLDYYQGCEAPLEVLIDVILFLKECAKYTAGSVEAKSETASRWNTLLDQIQERVSKWATPTGKYDAIKIQVGLVGPGRASLFEQIRQAWSPSSPPDRAFVTSPFFDPPEARNAPAEEIWKLLRQRGGSAVVYQVVTEPVPGTNGLFVYAPETLATVKPSQNSNYDIYFDKIEEMVSFENRAENFRPLHMKCIWIQNDQNVTYSLGSSNFTSPGMGLSESSNLEANLIYSWNLNSANKIGNLIAKATIDGTPISEETKLQWKPRRDESESEDNQILILPQGFDVATFLLDDGRPCLKLTFNKSAMPTGWKIRSIGQDVMILRESAWIEAGMPDEVKIAWPHRHLPAGLEVTWKNQEAWAFWPVNVADGADLPPPDELKDLPLDVLIEILLGSGPLHKTMRKWLRKKASEVEDSIDKKASIDPHSRVDVSAFLLQRTRRVSWAFAALRERLSKPCPTSQSLDWRLRGPVGVTAVKAAIVREASSDLERMFLLAELALELSRVSPVACEGFLTPRAVKKQIRKVIAELKNELDPILKTSAPRMKRYLIAAVKEAGE